MKDDWVEVRCLRPVFALRFCTSVPARSANTALNVFKSSGISRRMAQRR